MSLTEILLLGILIMQVLTLHNKADNYGRYMKLYDFITHALGRKIKRTDKRALYDRINSNIYRGIKWLKQYLTAQLKRFMENR